jgi:hypothetical protein
MLISHMGSKRTSCSHSVPSGLCLQESLMPELYLLVIWPNMTNCYELFHHECTWGWVQVRKMDRVSLVELCIYTGSPSSAYRDCLWCVTTTQPGLPFVTTAPFQMLPGPEPNSWRSCLLYDINSCGVAKVESWDRCVKTLWTERWAVPWSSWKVSPDDCQPPNPTPSPNSALPHCHSHSQDPESHQWEHTCLIPLSDTYFEYKASEKSNFPVWLAGHSVWVEHLRVQQEEAVKSGVMIAIIYLQVFTWSKFKLHPKGTQLPWSEIHTLEVDIYTHTYTHRHTNYHSRSTFYNRYSYLNF